MATWILLLALLGQEATLDSWEHARREWRGELEGRTCLKISNPLGSVTARPGDDGVVPLIAHLQTRTGTAVPKLLLDETAGDCMILEIRHPEAGDPREIGARVDLGLRLPPSLDRIEVTTTTGDVELFGTAAAITARSTSGDLRLSSGGRLTVSSDEGTVDAGLGGSAALDSSIESARGDVRLRLSQDVDLSVVVSSKEPPRTTGRCRIEPDESSASRSLVVCGKGGPLLRVSSDSGRVEVLG